MLASTFLTAEALGITEPERQVLIEFHRRASAGEIPGERFDMRQIGHPECGTPGCIIGWCGTIDIEASCELNRRYLRLGRHPIQQLFSCYAPHRTVSAAAEATYRYLTTGKV